MGSVIVIGANRGIGLEFTRQYLEAGCKVVATYRNEKTLDALHALHDKYGEALSLYPLEVTDQAAIERFSKTVKKVDTLILNAGIKGYEVPYTRPTGNTSDELRSALEVNTIAPDNIIRAFYPLLSEQEDAIVVYMGSRVGQTADNGSGASHPYRIAKAASHALLWNEDIELKLDWKKKHPTQLFRAPCAVAICAGWVRTDMGGPNARLSAEESVSGMLDVIEYVRATKTSNALYMYDGSIAEKYVTPPVHQEVFNSIPIASRIRNLFVFNYKFYCLPMIRWVVNKFARSKTS